MVNHGKTAVYLTWFSRMLIIFTVLQSFALAICKQRFI